MIHDEIAAREPGFTPLELEQSVDSYFNDLEKVAVELDKDMNENIGGY